MPSTPSVHLINWQGLWKRNFTLQGTNRTSIELIVGQQANLPRMNKNELEAIKETLIEANHKYWNRNKALLPDRRDILDSMFQKGTKVSQYRKSEIFIVRDIFFDGSHWRANCVHNSVEEDEGAMTVSWRTDLLFLRGKNDRVFTLPDHNENDLFADPKAVQSKIHDLLRVATSEESKFHNITLKRFEIDNLGVKAAPSLELAGVPPFGSTDKVTRNIQVLSKQEVDFLANNFQDIVISLLGECSVHKGYYQPVWKFRCS